AREAVATGALGTLLVVRAATHDPAPPTEAYVAASGGIFRDLHIHDFDAVRYVTGQEIVEVYADGAVRETPWFESHQDVDAAVAVKARAESACTRTEARAALACALAADRSRAERRPVSIEEVASARAVTG